jgi:hypothetical protein
MEKKSRRLLSGLIDDVIVIYLQRHLSSKSIDPSSVCHVQMNVGSNHGDTAFQFGALFLIKLDDEYHLDFEVMVCELICCKDSGHLLEETILERLTQGLEIISTFELHLFMEDELNSIIAKFHSRGPPTAEPTTSYTPITKVFVTGDLAFQAMALGKDGRALVHAMQGQSSPI